MLIKTAGIDEHNIELYFDVLQWWTWTQCVCRRLCSSYRLQCCSVSWLRRVSVVLRCGSECSISRYASDHPTSHTSLHFMYKVSLADNFIQMNFCFVNKLILCTIMSFCIFLLLITEEALINGLSFSAKTACFTQLADEKSPFTRLCLSPNLLVQVNNSVLLSWASSLMTGHYNFCFHRSWYTRMWWNQFPA